MQKKPTQMTHSTKMEASKSPALLAGEYLRGFERTVAQMGDFDRFLSSLNQILDNDRHLDGMVHLKSESDLEDGIPDFEMLTAEQAVFPVTGKSGNVGYLKYQGRRDTLPFEADDLHLVGAISGLIATLTYQAKQYKRQARAAQLMRYLVDQLPLPVICFDGEPDPFVLNTRAAELLQTEDGERVQRSLSEVLAADEETASIHFELDTRLFFAEGRRISIDDTSSISTFVIYDLSAGRAQLYDQLELTQFKSESNGSPFTWFLLKCNGRPGAAYAELQALSPELQISSDCIHAIDAHTAGCLFPRKFVAQVRREISMVMNRAQLPALRGSFGNGLIPTASGFVAKDVIQSGLSNMQELSKCLAPHVCVFECSDSISDSLKLILAGDVMVARESNLDRFKAKIEQAELDAIFIDVDELSVAQLSELLQVEFPNNYRVRIYYVTYRQPAMIIREFGLEASAYVIQKPFNAEFIAHEICDKLLSDYKK